MTPTPLRVDIVVAVVIAAIVLIASPGPAVDALLVLALLVVWAGMALDVRRRSGRRPPSP